MPTIKMLQQTITNMLETKEKIEKPQQSLSQEIEDIKKNQEKILEFKNTVCNNKK